MTLRPLRRLFDRAYPDPAASCRNVPDDDLEPEDPPVITDHEFQGYKLGDQLICIHLDGTRPCGGSAGEHARVVEAPAQP
jgi:hypothetical protein